MRKTSHELEINSMCAACGPGQLHGDAAQAAPDPVALAIAVPEPAPPARFAALRSRDCRWYLGGGLLSMMADNVEQYIPE
jgi:hypothetical protein